MSTPYATGRYTAAAVLSRPRSQAPLVTQLLFGEGVTVLETSDRYSRVLCGEGGPEGFVLTDQLVAVTEEDHRRQEDSPAFALELFCPIFSDDYGLPVTFGARLPHYDGIQLRHAGQRFRYSGQAILTDQLRPDAELMLRLARKWLYVPELRGGRTPTGVGSAELIQLLARLTGLRLPRSAAEMSALGTGVDFVVQCQEADLAFFNDDRGRVDHVGVILPNSEVLHVSGRVRIDALDHFGIFNRELGRYTHRLRLVRRLLPDAPREAAVRLEKKHGATGEVNQQILIF